MKLFEQYVGKVVINPTTKERYVLTEIAAPYVRARTEQLQSHGYHSHYIWETTNGDPISKGVLVFEDASLKEPFVTAYTAYSRTEDAAVERYFYWLMKE